MAHTFSFDVKSINNQLTDLFFAQSNTIYHIPLQADQSTDLFGYTESKTRPEVIKVLKKIFGLSVIKIGYDIKSTLHLLDKIGIQIAEPYHDILLMAYVADGTNQNDIINLVQRHFQQSNIQEKHFASFMLSLAKTLHKKLEKLNVQDLKDICRLRNISTKGLKKAIIIEKIKSYLEDRR